MGVGEIDFSARCVTIKFRFLPDAWQWNIGFRQMCDGENQISARCVTVKFMNEYRCVTVKFIFLTDVWRWNSYFS